MTLFKKTLLAQSVLVISTGVVAESTAPQLEESVVTALKKSESIQDIPLAISVLTDDEMENMTAERASDIASGVPNMLAFSPFGENQPIFVIRGQSMIDYNTNQGTSPVGVYVDETYIGANFLHGMTLFDLQRTEVLRGPQGTLYGKNTTGGAINFVTRTPSLDGTSGDVTLTVGDYGREHFDGAVETEIIDGKLGIRAAYTYTETDGHHENHFPGVDDLSSINTWAGRITLRYAGEKLDAILRYSTGESDSQATAVVTEGRVPVPGLGVTDRFGAFTNQLLRQPGWDAWEGSHNKAEPYSTEFDTASLTLNWDLGEHTLTSITSYLEGEGINQANTDGAPWKMLEVDFGSNVEQFSQELRIASHYEGSFNFVAGVYYDTHTNDVESAFELQHYRADIGIPFNPTNNIATVFSTGSPLTPTTSGFTVLSQYSQERKSFALYLHTTYDFTEKLGLTAGIRFTEDEGDGKDFHTQLADYDHNPVMNLIAPGSFSADNAEYYDSELTGKLGLDYQLSENTLLYTSYNRGYRSSAFNGGAQYSPNAVGMADPEYVDAFEIGFKSQLRQGTMQLNGAAFHYDYTDQQIIDRNGIQRFLKNGKQSNIRGLELEFIARMSENLTVNAGLGYLDTEIEGLSLADTLNGGTIELDGNELYNAPELNFNLAVNYVIANIDAGVFRISADTVYTAEQWFSAYNDELNYDEVKSDSNWISNARLSWESADDTLSVALWVKNLEDNDEPNSAINFQDIIGSDYYIMGLPRRMGVDLSYRF